MFDLLVLYARYGWLYTSTCVIFAFSKIILCDKCLFLRLGHKYLVVGTKLQEICIVEPQLSRP